MPNSGRLQQIVSSALLAAGLLLLLYGAFLHSASITPAEGDTAMASATGEISLIREVAIGGLERDASGQIKKTYSGQAPEACPT